MRTFLISAAAALALLSLVALVTRHPVQVETSQPPAKASPLALVLDHYAPTEYAPQLSVPDLRIDDITASEEPIRLTVPDVQSEISIDFVFDRPQNKDPFCGPYKFLGYDKSFHPILDLFNDGDLRTTAVRFPDLSETAGDISIGR